MPGSENRRTRRLAAREACILPLVLGLLPAPVSADRRRIVLDGRFDDWAALAPACADARGDGGAGAFDLGRIWLAEDHERLFLHFETGRDALLQSDCDLRLCLDTDDDPATGLLVWPLGVDFCWDFGRCRGVSYHDGLAADVSWREAGFTALPTCSAEQFEVCFDRRARTADGHLLFPAATVRLLLRDPTAGGDRAPDRGGALAYAFDEGEAIAPLEILSLPRPAARACRLLSYNVRRDGLFDPVREASFRRLLRAIDPDVIAFQEVYLHDAETTRARIASWLGGDWQAREVADLILVARGTIASAHALAGDRAAAFLVEPGEGWKQDLVVIDAHLSCCDHDGERREQAGAIGDFIRAVRAGTAGLPSASAIVLAGDLNLVGTSGPLDTLLSGELGLSERVPREPAVPSACTWIPAGDGYTPGRLDFILHDAVHTRSLLDVVLRTEALPAEYLEASALQAHDTGTASDHLPVFVDFVPAAAESTPGPRAAEVCWALTLAGPNPAIGEVKLLLLVEDEEQSVQAGALRWPEARGALRGCSDASSALRGAARFVVTDVTGRALARLSSPPLVPGAYPLVWNGKDGQGRDAAAGLYWISPPKAGEMGAWFAEGRARSIAVTLVR